MNRIVSFSLVAAIFAFFCLVPAFGQSGTGELTGLVTDSTGAVVSNATVILTNDATGEKRSTVTTGAGIYRFSAVPIVGTYTLDLAPKGFKAVKMASIVLTVGTVTSKDVQLEVGSPTETVTVEAGGEAVQTQESALSQLVDRNIWQNMPLQIRNQNSFIELVAGAVPQDGSGQNRGAVVNGTRGGTGSYLVEGMDNNEQGQAGRGQISFYDKGGAATSISPDAIQEYRVITNSYSSEYGKGGGFITDAVLRSGTNQWHGSAFEYNRIQALAANDWFSTRAGIKDSLVRNQFGGSLGGPIVKDKMFWYGVGEIHRVRQTYPTPAEQTTTQQFLDFVKTGGLETWAESDPGGVCVVGTGSACPGAFANSATWGPIFNTLYSNPAMHFPVVQGTSCAADPASCEAKGIWTGAILGLSYPVPVYGTIVLPDQTSQNEARWSLKWDYHISSNDSLSAFYSFQDATYIDPYLGGANFIGPTYLQDGRGQELGITWNHTFTPSVLNSFKVGYLRHRLDFPPPAGTFGTPSYYTLDGNGVDLGPSPGLPQFFTDNQFQYLDTISIVHGKHSFKMGGEYRRTRNGSSFFNGQFGFVLPWGIEDVLTDLKFSNEADLALTGGGYYGGAYYIQAAVDSTSTSSDPAPVLYRGFRANEWDAFVQDDWRVNNHFTVNLGLRWEYYGPPHNFQPGLDSNMYFGARTTPIIDPNTGNSCNDPVTGNVFCPAGNPFYAGVATEAFQLRNHDIWNKDTNNFGPRVGFAWDLFGKQKFVLRGGFGVMYDRIYNNTYENIRFNPPKFSLNTVFFYGPLTSPAPGQPDLFSYPFTTRQFFNDPTLANTPNPRHMNQGMVTPYYEQTHFGFQYEFAKGWVFEPEYVGTFGHKLTGLRDINTYNGRFAAGQASTDRPNVNIAADNYRSNDYNSNYHAFQATVRHVFSRGVTFNANYTYSKAMDEVSDLFLNLSGARPTDNMNLHNDYGPADFDVRHRTVFTVGYELPFMKQNRFLGGWGVNSIISYQTGHPFSPFSNSRTYDLNKDGYTTDRIVPIGSPSSTVLSSSAMDACIGDVADHPNGRCYFDTTKWVPYTCPASVNGGLWCDPPVHRNSIYGPAFANVDFNVSKRFKITESAGLTFQANFFNLFNHPNFVTPTVSQNLRNANFGDLTATAGDNGGHRVTQMALRFDF